MAYSLKKNVANLYASDKTNNDRILANYNHVKNMAKNNYSTSNNGNVKLALGFAGLNKNLLKLSNVRNYNLLQDLSRGYYSTRCNNNNFYSDQQKICGINSIKDPNIDGGLESALFYSEFNQNTDLIEEVYDCESDNVKHILDQGFNYKKKVKNGVIKIRSQFDRMNSKNWAYGGKTNSNQFRISNNYPIYFH